MASELPPGAQSDGNCVSRAVYRIQKNIGRGAYGTVYLGVDEASGEKFAIKRVQRKNLKADDLVRLEREIIILKSLQHPYIVSIHYVYQTSAHLTIVMDYVSEGELFDYLDSNKPLAPFQVQKLFRQITAATYFCHMNGIVHRDLKLENIFMDAEANIKIGDFGFANFIPPCAGVQQQRNSSMRNRSAPSTVDAVDGPISGEISSSDGGTAECSNRDRLRMGYGSRQNFLRTACGSPLYSSPEIISGRPYRGPEVDVWALGVILYCLNFGFMPFAADNKSMAKLKEKIVNGIYWLPDENNDIISLIKQLLEVDFTRRATMKQVCENEWLNSTYECLSRDTVRNSASPDLRTVEQQTVQLANEFRLTAGAELLRRLSHLSQSSNFSYKQALESVVTNRDSSPIRTATSSKVDVTPSLHPYATATEQRMPLFGRNAVTNGRATPMSTKIGTFSRIGGSPLFAGIKPLKFNPMRREGGSGAAVVGPKLDSTEAAVPVQLVGRFRTSPTMLDTMPHVSPLSSPSPTNDQEDAVTTKPQQQHCDADRPRPFCDRHRSDNVTSENHNNIANFSNFHDKSDGEDDTNKVLLRKISHPASSKKPIKVVDLTKPDGSDDEYARNSAFGAYGNHDQSYSRGLPSGGVRTANYADQILLPPIDDHAAQMRLREATKIFDFTNNQDVSEPKLASLTVASDISSFPVGHAPELNEKISAGESRDVELPCASVLPPTTRNPADDSASVVAGTAEPSGVTNDDALRDEQNEIASKQHIPPAYKIIVRRRTRKNGGDIFTEPSCSTSRGSDVQQKLRSRSSTELRRVGSPAPRNLLTSDDDNNERGLPAASSRRLNSSIGRRRRDAAGDDRRNKSDNTNPNAADKPPPSFRLASATRNRRAIRERLLGRRHSGGGILKWPAGSSGGGSDATGGSASESGGVFRLEPKGAAVVDYADSNEEDNDSNGNSDDADDDDKGGEHSISDGRRVVRGILKGGSLSSASHSHTTSPCTSAHASRLSVNHAAECSVAFQASSSRSVTSGPSQRNDSDAEDENDPNSPAAVDGASKSSSKPTRGILKKRSKSVGANNAPRNALMLGEGAASASAVCSRRSSRCSNVGRDDAEPQLVSIQRVLNAADARFFYDVDDDDDDDDDSDDGVAADGDDVSPPLRGILKGRERSQSSDSGKVLKSILKKDGSSGHLSTSTSRSVSPVTFASHSSSLANLQQQLQMQDNAADNDDNLESAVYHGHIRNNESLYAVDRTISFSFPSSAGDSSSSSPDRDGGPSSSVKCYEIVDADVTAAKPAVFIVPPQPSTSAAAVEADRNREAPPADYDSVNSVPLADDENLGIRASASGDFGMDDASFQAIDRSGSLSKRPLKSILKNRSESSDAQQHQQSAEQQHSSSCQHARHTSFSSNGGELSLASSFSRINSNNNYRRASSTPLYSASLTGRPSTSAAAPLDNDEHFRKQRQRSCSLDFALFGSNPGRRGFLLSKGLALSSSSSSSAPSSENENDLDGQNSMQRRRFKLRSILKKRVRATIDRDNDVLQAASSSAEKVLDFDRSSALDPVERRASGIVDDVEDGVDVQWISRLMQNEGESSRALHSAERTSGTDRHVDHQDAEIVIPLVDSAGENQLHEPADAKSDLSTDDDANTVVTSRFANLRVDVEPVFRSGNNNTDNASDYAGDDDGKRIDRIGGALHQHTATTYSPPPPPPNNSRPSADDAGGSVSSINSADDKNSRRSRRPSVDSGVNNAEFAGHTPRSIDPNRTDRTASAVHALASSSSSSRQNVPGASFFGLDFGDGSESSGVRRQFNCISPPPCAARRDVEFRQPVTDGTDTSGSEDVKRPEASVESSDSERRQHLVAPDDDRGLLRSSLRDSLLLTRERKASANDSGEFSSGNLDIPKAGVRGETKTKENYGITSTGVHAASELSRNRAPDGSSVHNDARVQQHNSCCMPRRSTDFSGTAAAGENLQQTLLRIAEQAVASRASARNSVSAATDGGNGDAVADGDETVASSETKVGKLSLHNDGAQQSDVHKADKPIL